MIRSLSAWRPYPIWLALLAGFSLTAACGAATEVASDEGRTDSIPKATLAGGSSACAQPPSFVWAVRHNWERDTYDTIFSGVATKIRESITAGGGSPLYDQGAYIPITFRVTGAFFGAVGSAVTVMNPGGSSNSLELVVEDTIEFQVGHEYGVVGHRNADGTVVTSGCTPTSAITSGEIEALRKMAP